MHQDVVSLVRATTAVLGLRLYAAGCMADRPLRHPTFGMTVNPCPWQPEASLLARSRWRILIRHLPEGGWPPRRGVMLRDLLSARSRVRYAAGPASSSREVAGPSAARRRISR